MATAVLFVGWNRPVPGHEKDAWAFLSGPAMDKVREWEKKGYCERHELFGLTAHGGDLNGAMVLFGERAKLDELRRTDEFEHFSLRLGMLLDGYGVVPGVNEAGIKKVMERNPELS
jgi:hypothetical protein